MNRVPAHTGVEVPIVQAPMGWIARSQLASAVSYVRALRTERHPPGTMGAIGPRRVLTFNATAFVCYTESN